MYDAKGLSKINPCKIPLKYGVLLGIKDLKNLEVNYGDCARYFGSTLFYGNRHEIDLCIYSLMSLSEVVSNP